MNGSDEGTQSGSSNSSCMHHWFVPQRQTEVVSRGRYNHTVHAHVPWLPNAMLWNPLAIAEFGRKRMDGYE
jgi:hypothetical protein